MWFTHQESHQQLGAMRGMFQLHVGRRSHSQVLAVRKINIATLAYHLQWNKMFISVHKHRNNSKLDIRWRSQTWQGTLQDLHWVMGEAPWVHAPHISSIAQGVYNL